MYSWTLVFTPNQVRKVATKPVRISSSRLPRPRDSQSLHLQHRRHQNLLDRPNSVVGIASEPTVACSRGFGNGAAEGRVGGGEGDCGLEEIGVRFLVATETRLRLLTPRYFCSADVPVHCSLHSVPVP